MFSIKYTLFEFRFCTGNVDKIQNWTIFSANEQTPSFFLNCAHCGAPNTLVGNFFQKIDSLFYLNSVQEIVEIFKISPFRVDWLILYSKTAHNMGSQIQEWAIF